MENKKFPTEEESLENYRKFTDEIEQKMWGKTEPMILDPKQGINRADFVNNVSEVLGIDKVHVATGRKAGREKKSSLESLKVHKHKVVLAAKRDEVNFVENILDNTRVRSIPTKWNTAMIHLDPSMAGFIEEGILQENLRKIQGFK